MMSLHAICITNIPDQILYFQKFYLEYWSYKNIDKVF